MNKRSQYKSTEYMIIIASALFILITVLMFLNDTGITGFATRAPSTTILFTPNETITEPTIEEPVEIVSEQKEPEIEIQAGCVTPYSGMTISSNTVFCTGTYTLSNSIYINNSDNFILDCNGSIIQGDYATKYRKAIRVGGNNVTIKNCIIKGFSVGIWATNYDISPVEYEQNLNVYNNTFVLIGGLGAIFIDGYRSFNINNNFFYNFTDYYELPIGPHAIYASGFNQNQAALGGNIYNNWIENTTASGIKFNGVGTIKNIRVYNNTIKDLDVSQTDDIGVSMFNVDNISVFNNNFTGTYATTTKYATGIMLSFLDGSGNPQNSSRNCLIYNNIFQGLAIAIQFRENTSNNYVYNNTYINIVNSEFRTKSKANFSIFEDDLIKVTYGNSPYQNILYLNFTGTKNFTINSLNFTIRNGQSQWYPYDDVKNATTVLAFNVDTYSKILSTSQPLYVGDFVAGTPPENNPPTMDSITLTSNLTCITSASDPDDDELTTIIEFYLNNTLNKTVTATSSTQTNYSGTHYCRARAYDGQNYSQWITSNNVTINATTSAQPLNISDINLASDLNCSATVNQQANISIAFYNNNTINTTHTLQNINGSFSSKISNSSGIWQCSITANNSINTTTATSNTVIIDSINNPPTINVSLSNELNCSTISYDPDNDALTTFIEWYYNDSLNKTITADSDIQTNYSGTHYCRARAYDGQDYSQWATSDTITTTINETDIPPIISYLSLSNSLVCSGTVNELTNMTIIFYHNTEVNATSIQQDIIGAFTASAIESDGEWYCKAIASDGMNTTTASSNTITIETNKKSSSGGRSGGSSQSIPITPSKPEPNITKEETVKNAETKTPQKSINTEPEIIESEEKPIIEIPTIIKSSKYRPLIVCMVIFLILAIAVLFTIKPVETNPKIIEYTTKSLNLGYSYNAIRISLQKYVPDAVIDHHFHMLKMHNKKPIIRIQTPIDKTITDPNAVLAMKQSIAKHRAYGFKDKDIEKMLLSNGYPKSLIEASIKA